VGAVDANSAPCGAAGCVSFGVLRLDEGCVPSRESFGRDNVRGAGEMGVYSHAPLLPAAFASVPFGFVLVRVRVRVRIGRRLVGRRKAGRRGAGRRRVWRRRAGRGRGRGVGHLPQMWPVAGDGAPRREGRWNRCVSALF
jgi:hypothetical protein